MLDVDFNTGIKFLQRDKYLGPVIRKMEPPFFPKEKDYFQSLAKYIIYQQLSIIAARKIYERFIFLFDNNSITPKNFKKKSIISLRNIGISKSKIMYITEVANIFIDDCFFLSNINNLKNKDIINILTSIKGVGPWTANMFLMFTMHRLDIFAVNDLGIKKGIQRLFKLNDLPSNDFMLKISDKWSPYRTIACLYLWKIIDGNNFEW